MKRRHDPERTCLGCGARDRQESLIRIVARNDGILEPDRKSGGRGGYLHKTKGCWDAFLKRKKIHQAFHREIAREAREKLIVTLRMQFSGEKDGKDQGPSTGQRAGNRD